LKPLIATIFQNTLFFFTKLNSNQTTFFKKEKSIKNDNFSKQIERQDKLEKYTSKKSKLLKE
jgi:hypothetical protein